MTEELYPGKFATFVREVGWEFVKRRGISGIVAITAVTKEDELLLVEQFRPPVGRPVVELPSGLAGDMGDEDLVEAARRELLEETGYEASIFHHCGRGTASAGLTDEVIDFFRAKGLRRTGEGGGDATERITVYPVKLWELDLFLRARERAGSLVDLKIFSGLWLAGIRRADVKGPPAQTS